MKKEELLSSGYVEIINGLFLINEEGNVYRKKHEEWSVAPIFKIKGYKAISCYSKESYKESGHGNTTVYLHKALAEAFIPNPKGYNRVAFKNENKEDTSLKNLYWTNQSELNEKSDKVKEMYLCSVCQDPEKRKRVPFICNSCSRKRERIAKAKEELKAVNRMFLDEISLEIYNKRMDGKTIAEIARELELSRQWVSEKNQKMMKGEA